jgi:glycolate oxidase iron-sulfur subunit
MRTNFTVEQKQDPAIASSEAELRRCVHCGFCTASCPTYVLEGNELDGPRGRIMLIQDMLETGAAPKPETVFHIDRCLSCLSCATACPSGVDYGRLIETARIHIEQTYKRPLVERLLRQAIGRILPDRKLFGLALELGRLARPFAKLLPARLAAMLRLLPARVPRMAPVLPGHYLASGSTKLRVALFTGCVQDALSPAINAAAIRVLTKLGAEVILPETPVCCGALTHHLGDETRTQAHAQATLGWAAPLLAAGVDHIVVTAAGCGTLLKDYGHLVGNADARLLAGRVLDVSEAIEKLGLPDGLMPPRPLTLAYQSACSLQHGQRLHARPRALLAAAGFTVIDLPEAHLCCGSAGTYNMLEPEMAERLAARKRAAIAMVGADAVASGNIGCITQLAPGLDIPIAHSVEWLDWALGGEEPTSVSSH